MHVCVSVNARVLYVLQNICESFWTFHKQSRDYLSYLSTPPNFHTRELPGWLLRRLTVAPPWSPAFSTPSHKVTAVRARACADSRSCCVCCSQFAVRARLGRVPVLQLSEHHFWTLKPFIMSAVPRRSSMGVSDVGKWFEWMWQMSSAPISRPADSRAVYCFELGGKPNTTQHNTWIESTWKPFALPEFATAAPG